MFCINESIIQENEIRTNQMAEKVLLAFCGLLLLLFLLACAGIADLGSDWALRVFATFPVTLLAVCLLIRKSGYDKPWTKHLVIVAIMLVTGALYFMYPLNATFLTFGPIMVSVSYYNRKFTRGVTLMTLSTTLLTMLLNMLLSHVSPAILAFQISQGAGSWQDTQYILAVLVFPRAAVIVITGAVSALVARNGRKMVLEQENMTRKASKVEADLNAAADIQIHTMPDPLFTTPDRAIHICAYLQPAKEVGGDFFDYMMINDHLLAFMVADVSDKSLPSAMFVMRAQSEIRFALSMGAAAEGDEPESVDLADAIRRVNRHLVKNNPEGMFVTAWIGCVDCRTGMGKYVNAGHLPPLIRHADGSIGRIASDPQLFLGVFEQERYETGLLQLEKGDTLVLFTDGVTDARSLQDVTFEHERLRETIHGVSAAGAGNMADKTIAAIRAALERHTAGAKQFDDITLLALDYMLPPQRKEYEFTVPAASAGVSEAIDRIQAMLEAQNCPEDVRQNMGVVADEICGNIADYAYDHGGEIHIRCTVGANFIRVTFMDTGKPFNPLEEEAPVFTDEPRLGGLGIYLSRNLTDDMEYRYVHGENRLTILKIWNV